MDSILFGFIFFKRYLRNVSFETTSKIKGLADKPDIVEFNPDGTLKYTTLNVVNLNEHHQWTQVFYSFFLNLIGKGVPNILFQLLF